MPWRAFFLALLLVAETSEFFEWVCLYSCLIPCFQVLACLAPVRLCPQAFAYCHQACGKDLKKRVGGRLQICLCLRLLRILICHICLFAAIKSFLNVWSVFLYPYLWEIHSLPAIPTGMRAVLCLFSPMKAWHFLVYS